MKPVNYKIRKQKIQLWLSGLDRYMYIFVWASQIEHFIQANILEALANMMRLFLGCGINLTADLKIS